MVTSDEKLFGFIAWLFSIVGALVALLAGPKTEYVKKWASLSIAYVVVVVVVYVFAFIVSFIPFIGIIIFWLIQIAVILVWLWGILVSLRGEYWNPPVIGAVADKIYEMLRSS